MSERVRNLVAAVVILGSLGVITTTLLSADPSEADRVRYLASRLTCPVCQSVSIADSPSGIARDLHDLIAQQVAQGWSDDDVIAHFVGIYGESVLLDPPVDLRTLALWLLPVIAVALGLGAIASRKARLPDRELTPVERLRLDEALRRRGAG